MAYFPPIITAAGLSLPLFTDIQLSLLGSYSTIYGITTYLGNDSADYQMISAIALKLTDNCNLCQLAYNSRSPLTAIGAALDSVVKNNGITRLSSSLSTVVLTLSGISGTTITNGVISDTNGVLWNLPSSVVIGSSGSIMVSAVCQQSGPISASPNTITTPVGGFTAGWTGVTNTSAAVVGTPPETDSALRARQSISVALPSSTRLAGTTADVKAVSGVTRTNIMENQLSVVDSLGNAAHSLTCVVEGGTDLAVATAIFVNRGIGPNTLGAVSGAGQYGVNVTDPNSGNITSIGIIRPTPLIINVAITVHGLNAGFTTATQAAIILAIANYLKSLQIGETVFISVLYGVVLSVMPNLSLPLFSITILQIGVPLLGNLDIGMPYYQVAANSIGNTNIALTVV